MILSHFPENRRYSSLNHLPFNDGAFYELLETSKVIGAHVGWYPLYFEQTQTKSLLPGFLKTHSFGEYIFDHSWAHFYQQNNSQYYPKLLFAHPFTPVNAPKILGHQLDFKELVDQAMKTSLELNLSGIHFLFISQEEEVVLKELGFVIKETLQFHFFNHYNNFEHFLEFLKPNRKKMIKKERAKIQNTGLTISWQQGSDLTSIELERMYQLYLETIHKKQSHPYLNQSFFQLLPFFMKDKALFITAKLHEEIVAMALYFQSPHCLYGRYWGVDSRLEDEFPFLHFELCYYRGIDYCMDHKIPLFQAGAQGEHKLWRGFQPVTIKSAHLLHNEKLFPVIKQDIQRQNRENQSAISHYEHYLPFKKDAYPKQSIE